MQTHDHLIWSMNQSKESIVGIKKESKETIVV